MPLSTHNNNTNNIKNNKNTLVTIIIIDNPVSAEQGSQNSRVPRRPWFHSPHEGP